MVWPRVENGQLSGLASINVCIDRTGKVREPRALNHDHPDVAEAARAQLMHWTFRPSRHKGYQFRPRRSLRLPIRRSWNRHMVDDPRTAFAC